MQGDESLRLVTLFLRLSGTPRRLHEESCDIGILLEKIIIVLRGIDRP